MAYVGDAARDMCVQRAFSILRERGYQAELSSCYWRLLGVLDREGEKALYEYARTIPIVSSTSC